MSFAWKMNWIYVVHTHNMNTVHWFNGDFFALSLSLSISYFFFYAEGFYDLDVWLWTMPSTCCTANGTIKLHSRLPVNNSHQMVDVNEDTHTHTYTELPFNMKSDFFVCVRVRIYPRKYMNCHKKTFDEMEWCIFIGLYACARCGSKNGIKSNQMSN